MTSCPFKFQVPGITQTVPDDLELIAACIDSPDSTTTSHSSAGGGVGVGEGVGVAVGDNFQYGGCTNEE